MSAADRVLYWQRRARDAERMLQFEKEHNEHTLQWAREAFTEQRRMTDRCTVLYVLAARLGATDAQLCGEDVPEGEPVELLKKVATWDRDAKSWVPARAR